MCFFVTNCMSLCIFLYFLLFSIFVPFSFQALDAICMMMWKFFGSCCLTTRNYEYIQKRILQVCIHNTLDCNLKSWNFQKLLEIDHRFLQNFILSFKISFEFFAVEIFFEIKYNFVTVFSSLWDVKVTV